MALKLLKRIQSLIGNGRQEPGPVDAEKLRFEFRRRYHWFRRLIRADRTALDDMAVIQKMLHEDTPYGMVRVKTVCAKISLEVWKTVDSLRKLAPERYHALEDNFKIIRSRIDERLQPAHKTESGPMILDMSDIGLFASDIVGRKLSMLGEISGSGGMKTPGGFAITAAGFHYFMNHNQLGDEIERRIRAADATDLDELHALSSSIQSLIMESPLPDEMAAEFAGAAAKYQGSMAVRSSALSEDAEGSSFAGLHGSILNVDPENLVPAYKEVVAGLYSLPAMTYRLNRGIPDSDAVMCVGVLEMIEARSGGVLYTADPLGRKAGFVINSVWGLPKPVVEGRCAGDVLRVSEDAQQVLEIIPEEKACMFSPLPEEGVARLAVADGERDKLSLGVDEGLELASLAAKLVEQFGGPLDVEWVITSAGEIIILQCRPLAPVSLSTDVKGRGILDSDHLLAGGVAASPGIASGPVHHVEKAVDVLDFPEGAVLVTPQAHPSLASLLGRAAAVVAETGSVTGHLATVCREYGVPAIFGLDGAVGVLEQGKEVTVDADGGFVKEGSAVGRKARGSVWSRIETPVRKTLREAAAFITPLKLIDPSSPYFLAENVRSYHDIVRFCHQKAVEEMFSFGRDHKFPERSSKQLEIGGNPTRWWVLNLDDGFESEVQGKFVSLEEIACRPMLAIWQGVSASPWQGPPPVDAGGFLSVVFRSTLDGSLAPGARAKQTERNYFMISRNYCCLTSRLGYHFSTIETLVAGRESENYASFRFQGGAADDERRMRRVHLIAKILEDAGFTAEIREDRLNARVQGLPEERMYELLRTLGYLSIHTRQLDMVLSGAADIRHYDKKLRTEMNEAMKQLQEY